MWKDEVQEPTQARFGPGHRTSQGVGSAGPAFAFGQAAALAALQDRKPFANLSAPRPLREPTLPSVRRPPSPLDFYLSWMSPVYPLFWANSTTASRNGQTVFGAGTVAEIPCGADGSAEMRG